MPVLCIGPSDFMKDTPFANGCVALKGALLATAPYSASVAPWTIFVTPNFAEVGLWAPETSPLPEMHHPVAGVPRHGTRRLFHGHSVPVTVSTLLVAKYCQHSRGLNQYMCGIGDPHGHWTGLSPVYHVPVYHVSVDANHSSMESPIRRSIGWIAIH